MAELSFAGLSFAPAQTWASVRVVPIMRDAPAPPLRLARQAVNAGATVKLDARTRYTSYVPHALVVRSAAGPQAAYGTALTKDGTLQKKRGHAWMDMHRLAKRLPSDGRHAGGARFLPLHVAIEGFLALHFGGPDVAWAAYSERALRHGFSPRWEAFCAGSGLYKLDDALRWFEIRDGQVGAALFLGSMLASVMITPHPDDYRALHRTFLTDLFGDTLYWEALYGAPAAPLPIAVHQMDHVQSWDDVAAVLDADHAARQAQSAAMLDEVRTAPRGLSTVMKLGAHKLMRFIPDLAPGAAHHLGEMIVGADGHLAYLKTLRLAPKQARRGHLLQTLAAHDWALPTAADAMGVTEKQLLNRIVDAGFGAMLRAHLRERG